MYNLFGESFRFQAERYEEWLGGRCISKGNINSVIIATVNGPQIDFQIRDKGNLSMDSQVCYDLSTSNELFDNRIQYATSWNDGSSTKPIVCHVFIKDNQDVDYVRFAMTNPDRIIEFYGKQIKDGNIAINQRMPKDNLKLLINVIGHIQQQFRKIGEQTGNWNMVYTSIQSMEMFRNGLLMAWQEFQYGWHSDFWEEGHSMLEYDMMEMRASEILPELISLLQTESPFRRLERNGKITNDIISVYKELLSIINNGGLKHC